MFFRKKTATPPPLESRSPLLINEKVETNPLLDEVWRLFWLTLAVIVALGLLSYSPQDPSWSTWTSSTAYSNWMGRLGSISSDFLFQSFGLAAFVLLPLLLAVAWDRHRASPKIEFKSRSSTKKLILHGSFVVAVSAFIQTSLPASFVPWNLPNPGGVFGRLLGSLVAHVAGTMGATIITLSAATMLGVICFRIQFLSVASKQSKKLFTKSKEKLPSFWTRLREQLIALSIKWKGAPKSIAAAETPPPVIVEKETAAEEISPATTEIPDEDLMRIASGQKKVVTQLNQPHRPARRSKNFQLPQVSMLSGKADSKTKSVDKNWYVEKAQILVQKLKDFGVEGEIVHISPGPVITVYEFKPASGVKIKEIANLSDNLTLALSVLSVRIVAPIPGKPVVGIEIPSPHREIVFFKDMVQETNFFKEEIRIPIALGRLASGEAVTADLAAMPHLLVAGTTGTGKSVFINTLISSVLCRFTPKQLKLILVDPKMVELSNYEGIPHLLLPVVVDSRKAALALRWAVEEMERRYALMHQSGVRHVDSYNQRANGSGGENLPYIVVVIDEYADLMAVVPKDVEMSIARLAQKARAAGIHLVLATQRPSTDVVTGTIKANFPSRISFRVASSVDSKTILDRAGADRLLGNGDMLFHSAGFTTLKRMQGAFISDVDIEKIVRALKEQGEPEYDERVMQQMEEDEMGVSSEGNDPSSSDDGLYDAAVRLVTEKGEASISLIQRHLRIGYNRAATLMEELESQGVVAQSTHGSKRRAVLVSSI